jgi:ABC-2 type transport system permease protein
MMLSNLIFFSFWWIYFRNFQSIKGWSLQDMACLYGVVTGSYGFFCVFFGGARFIARMIHEGDLDAYMIKPTSLLIQILGGKSIPAGWGDILSGFVMVGISGYITWKNCLLLGLLFGLSTTIILSFSILMNSLAFWIGDSHALSKQLFEFLLTFSNYPRSIYFGGVKFLLLTLIPSGFIGYIPVEIIRDYSLVKVFGMFVVSVVYFLFARKIFFVGLKKYTSGNKLGFRI